MSEHEEHDISKKITCLEGKVDRVLRAIEGDRNMGQDGLAKQVKSNRERIISVVERVQTQERKMSGWAGFMGALGASLGAVATILAGWLSGFLK